MTSKQVDGALDPILVLLSPSWTDFTTVALLAVSACAAIFLWWSTKESAKKRNSFDHIATQTRDHDLIRMFEEFRAIRRHFVDKQLDFSYDNVMREEVELPNGTTKRAENVVKKVFNYYEATAIGIKRGALENSIIKEWWRKTYIQHWIEFKGYVRSARERDSAPKLFKEYQCIVEKWAEPSEVDLIKM